MFTQDCVVYSPRIHSKQQNMWSRRAQKDKHPSLKVAVSLPALSNKKYLVSSSSKSHSLLEDKIVSTLGGNMSWSPSLSHSTRKCLSSRHREVSQWQVQFSEIMGQLEREITAVEQLKDIVGDFLQERELYSHLMNDCITATDSLRLGVQREDLSFTELKKEERQTNDSRKVLQAQVYVLLSKISSLKKIHHQLEKDFHAKGVATKQIRKCITLEFNTSSSCLYACQQKTDQASYNMWLSRCKDLKMMANNLMKDSSSFRGNLKFTLANIKKVLEQHRRRTDGTLRKKILELTRNQDILLMEKKLINDEISHQTKELQKLEGQIRTCDTKLQQASQRLNILNQRPGYEDCRDLPHITLTQENDSLDKKGNELRSMLNLSYPHLVLKRKNLLMVEDNLATNAHMLEMVMKCQSLHQAVPPAHNTIVVLSKM